MSEEEKQTLMDDVKNYLDITYDDDLADKKLLGIMTRGMNYLNGIAGMELNYTCENQERQLLFDYCRYARSNDLEAFKINFGSDLVMLRIQNGVEDYAGQI